MPRKVIVGGGITAREAAEYDAKAGEAPSFENWNNGIKEGGGLFGAISLEAAQACEKILRNANVETAPIDSPEDFAQVIAKHIAYAKNEIQAGDADRAARFAFVAGVEWARVCMKWAWEADALRGEKVAGGQRNGAHRTNTRHASQREKRLARMRDLVPRMGADSAAAQCESEGLGKHEAVKRQWNRHRMKIEEKDK